MGLFTWLDGRIKNKLHWYHISAVKLCVLAFALWLAELWPALLQVNPWVYAVVWIVCMLYLFWVLLK